MVLVRGIKPNNSEEETMKMEWRNGDTKGLGSSSDHTKGRGLRWEVF